MTRLVAAPPPPRTWRARRSPAARHRQLPDAVTLDVAGDGPARPGLELVARAYGIEDRVRFGDSDAGTRVDASVSPGDTAAFLASVSPGGAASARRGDDSVLAGHRVTLITNRITHYRVPLWNLLARRLEAAGCALHVVLSAGRGATSEWMVHDDVAFDHADADGDLAGRLKETAAPTLVITGSYDPRIGGRAAHHASRHGAALGLWSGEVPWGATGESRLRRAQRRWTMRHARFALSYGSAATDYVHALRPGLPQVVVRNTSTARAVAHEAQDGGPLRLLAVSQAIHRKGLDVIVEAMALLEPETAHLVVAGGGDRLGDLRARAGGLPNVEVLGAVPSDEVGALYARAEAFLFPTRFDVFGLVLPEALGAGLPAIASESAGATFDLLAHERNGLRVAGHDPARWAAAIGELAADRARRAAMAAEARATVAARWTLEHSADAWTAGLRLGAMLHANIRREQGWAAMRRNRARWRPDDTKFLPTRFARRLDSAPVRRWSVERAHGSCRHRPVHEAARRGGPRSSCSARLSSCWPPSCCHDGRTPNYQASTGVFVETQAIGTSIANLSAGSDPVRVLQTQTVVARIPAVLERAAKKLPGTGITADYIGGVTRVGARRTLTS